MSRLAQNNRVLYVEPRVYSASEALRAVISSSRQRKRMEQIGDGLWVYRHPIWGWHNSQSRVEQLGHKLRILAVRSALKKLQMESPILWVVNPCHGDMVGHLGESLVCYHVVDNYAAGYWHSEQDSVKIAAADQFMLSIADLVLVTSPALLKEKQRYNRNVHLVKNAVDYAQFVAMLQHSKEPPADMATLPPPIIGYVGAVNSKLDYELLNTVARTRPDWSIVLVGPIGARQPRVQRFVKDHPPNVYFLGQRDVTEVPKYVNASHVCMLPYCRDSYTANIDSLKLYEYLACEKPVVATDIPVARERSEVVHIAEDAADFVAQIERALVPASPERRMLGRLIASQNTWDQRVEQISSLIQAVLPG